MAAAKMLHRSLLRASSCALLLVLLLQQQPLGAEVKQLRVSGFRDITAFLLETAQRNYGVDMSIKYVKSAGMGLGEGGGGGEQPAPLACASYNTIAHGGIRQSPPLS